MIEKSLPVPACSRYALDFPLSALKKGGKINGVHLAHMKEEDGALVCAEGLTFRYEVEQQFDGLYVVAHEIFALVSQPRCGYLLVEGRKITGLFKVNAVLNYYEKDGKEGTLFVGTDGMYRLTETNCGRSKLTGGTCAALHCERAFVGKGQVLYYSEPMYLYTWNYSTYQAGEILFCGDQGNILGIESFHGKLYVFFEKGISVLTAFADPLNYKVEPMPCRFGKNINRSFANCGGAVYFFTERGLCVLDDSGCKLVEDADIGDIDFSEPVYAVSFGNKYYAAVRNLRGESVIYCYDGVTGRGNYINHPCEYVGANFGMFLSQGTSVYELSGKSLPTVGECALSVDFSLDHKSGAQYLESVSVTGAGKINVLVTNPNGEQATAAGECGKRLRLSRALCGESFRLKILPENEDFAIRALSLGVRRDDA